MTASMNNSIVENGTPGSSSSSTNTGDDRSRLAMMGRNPADEELIDDIARGMIYAALTIADDGTSPSSTKSAKKKKKPWTRETLRLLTGFCDEDNRIPLGKMLKSVFKLTLDYPFHVKDLTFNGTTLDTHGYIAHNDKVIVLSYRCDKSAFDWLENVPTKTTAFDPDEDLTLDGTVGIWNGIDHMCCREEFHKFYVHADFYNNFLSSLNMVNKYVGPLLDPDQPPRKFFVTGHSLGAGIATVATAYFLLRYDWQRLPHSFVSVTAGAPRVCSKAMKTAIDERRMYLGKSATCYRLVKGRDIMTTVPPSSQDFQHLVPPVFISENGQIIIKRSNTADDADLSALKELRKVRSSVTLEQCDSADKSKYEQVIEQIPRPLRDHFASSYLRPLLQAKGISCGKDLDKPPRPMISNKHTDLPSVPEESSPVAVRKKKPSRLMKNSMRIFGCIFRRKHKVMDRAE